MRERPKPTITKKAADDLSLHTIPFTKEIDEAGNETAYTYDVDGNITRILDAWGNVLHTKNGSGTEITLFDRIWF